MTADYWKRWPVPFTFTAAGDEATGTIVGLGDLKEKWPELHIRQADGLVRVVRVTQVRLHELLGELIPCVGDRVRIRYIGDAPKAAPGMSPVKEFTVEIRRQDPQSQGRPDENPGENGKSENVLETGAK